MELEQFLAEVDALLSQPTAINKRVAEDVLLSAVQENFEAEGERGGRERWVDLHPYTIERRAEKGTWPGKILQDEGDLFGSFVPVWDGDTARLETDDPKANKHEFGEGVPQRSFMWLADSDWEAIADVVVDEIVKLI